MKKMKKLSVLLICAIAAFALCACAKSGDDPAVTPEETPAAEAETITISLYHGDELLGTIDCKVGEKLTGYEQYEVLEGYTFQGWYGTPTFLATSKKDLTKDTFEKSRSLYANFKNNNATPDTRKWYVVGTSTKSKALKDSAWAGSSVDDTAKDACELKATGNVTNEFSITIDLYKDDKFQIIHDWQWDGQMGFGMFTQHSENDVTSGGGLSGESSKADVLVVQDGNYTITLTTDPDDPAQDTLTIVRNGDAAPAEEIEEEPFVPGETTQVYIKGSWVSDWSENIELTRTEGTNIYTVTKELEAGTEVYFTVWDNGADTGIGMNSSAVTDDASKALIDTEAYNTKVLEAGTYTFTVDVDALTVTITK